MENLKINMKDDLKTYEPSDALKQIIDMSRALGRPLLLTGKPGTGKTQFAHWYALQNEFNPKVFQFNTKSTSVYSDLFYEYDAVSHFRDKEGEKETSDFITLTAMGKAVVCAKGIDNIDHPELKKIAKNSEITAAECLKKVVVLIDEVDKAPRDFPNDLLHEIDRLSFKIKELNNFEVTLDDDQKRNIIIILTSNDEKNLPDAFLRRCLFHYIEFPDKDRLTEIIEKKLKISGSGVEEKLVCFYETHANDAIDKKPSTSECIEWVNYLKAASLIDTAIKSQKSEKIKMQFRNSLSILLKKKEDLEEAIRMFGLKEIPNSPAT